MSPGESTRGASERREALKEVFARARVCTRCPELASTRKTVVFGAGDADAELMFIGEAPGASEDEQGLPFVGRAGKLLESLLVEIGLSRAEVFIANVLKCRPPGNRDPQPVEIENCREYLLSQVELIQPAVICTLGNFSTKLLRGDPTGITRLHGQPEVIVLGERAVQALPDLPPGRRPLHAPHAPDAARGLRAAARAARARCPRAARADAGCRAREPRASPWPAAPARTGGAEDQLGLF